MVDIVEKHCAFCGKEFYPTPGHAYFIGRKGHGAAFFCKYTCMLRYREKVASEKKYKRRDEVKDDGR